MIGMIELPEDKQEALYNEPLSFLYYGLEKIGKSTIASQLPNSLHIDFEGGTKYIKTARVDCDSWETFLKIKDAIIARNKPYSFILIDTLTMVETYCRPLATEAYMKTNQGKNFNRDKFGKVLPKEEWNDVIEALGQNGYLYVFNAWRYMMDTIMELKQEKKYPDNPTKLIFIGHTKDKFIDPTVLDQKANSKELDLTGKLKLITLQSYCDSIAYCYRDKQGELIFSFISGDGDISAGSRVGPIGQKINGKDLWKTLYPSLNLK